MKFRTLLIIAIYCCLVTTSFAQTRDVVTDVFSSQLDSLVEAYLPQGSHVGIYAYDLTDDQPLYAYEAEKLSRPASTMKLITAISALAHPQGKEPFRTEVWYRGNIEQDTLCGDIYVVGSMDPEFNNEALDSLVNMMTSLPFCYVKGNLYGDVSLKDSIYWGKGWSWDDTPNAYQPYLSPLMLQKGAVEIAVSPTTKGMPADVLFTPLSTYYTITNNTQTTTPDAGKFVFSRNWLENGNDLIVSGNVERKRTSRVNIYEPEKFFMHTLQERLEAYGMQFSNRYAFKEMLPIDSCSLLMAYETPIQAVLDEMMKESDNLNAEAMLYRLAWQATGKRHLSSDEALKPLQERIDALGYKASNYRIVDGCGLSNYNAVSAELLVAFLRFAYSQPDIYSAIYQALPIAGIDGTLQSRMRRGSPAYRNVRAKTGTVTGICTLAGYLTASNGHQIAFAILNQNHLAHRDARLLQDKVCEFLCGYR